MHRGPEADPTSARSLTGAVRDGVEHGSVVLAAQDGRTYQLGSRWRHLVGRRVRVTGRPRTGLMTTAQQGTPFTVDDVEDLGAADDPEELR